MVSVLRFPSNTIWLEFTDIAAVLELYQSSTKHHDSHELRLPLFILFIDTTMLEARGLKVESFRMLE